MNQRLSLGKYFGIRLYVHWTFALLLAFVAFQSWAEGLVTVAFMISIILSVFLCVTLHEYGHALAARRFGIPTVDITLLPIGGVARLERMPRIPWQELVVAIAGPAVNVVIALTLGTLLFATGAVDFFGDFVEETPAAIVQSEDVVTEHTAATSPAVAAEKAALAHDEVNPLEQPSLLNYVIILFGANTMLVLFNMVPAFPMDGGRVFRALLAMFMDYRKATFIASRVGFLCAGGLALLWWNSDSTSPFFLILVVFVVYAGMSEAKQVDVMESVRGLLVKDAMIHSPPFVDMDMTLHAVAQEWQSTSLAAMPVLSYADTVTGVIKLIDVTKAIQAGVSPHTPVGQLADHSVPKLNANRPLEDVIMSLPRSQRQFPVVDALGVLVGLLDLDTVKLRGQLSKINPIVARDGASNDDALGNLANDNGSREGGAGDLEAGTQTY